MQRGVRSACHDVMTANFMGYYEVRTLSYRALSLLLSTCTSVQKKNKRRRKTRHSWFTSWEGGGRILAPSFPPKARSAKIQSNSTASRPLAFKESALVRYRRRLSPVFSFRVSFFLVRCYFSPFFFPFTFIAVVGQWQGVAGAWPTMLICSAICPGRLI